MIDINELINSGADADAIMEAVKKNLEEKRVAEEKKRQAEETARAKAEEKENLCREARAHLINAILAYDDAFHFLGEEPVDEATIVELENMIKVWEKRLPTMFRVSFDNKNIDVGKLWRQFGLGFWL
jgi:hypothetical protein